MFERCGATVLDQHHLCCSSTRPKLVAVSVIAENVGSNFDEYMTMAEHVHYGTWEGHESVPPAYS